MGALHEGHAALARAAKNSGLPLVLSIFVNPTQFGPGEDFSRYPRQEEADLALCEREGVDAVFLPTAEEMYPPGFSTVVAVPELAACMCGSFRPGHFDGVATVVARFFGILEPRLAFFGWKDAQQFLIIRRMAADLDMNVTVIAVDTVREEDGLAMSSRNAYLTPNERSRAPELYRALTKGREAAMEGARAGEITRRVRKHLAVHGFETEYADLRSLETLKSVDDNQALSRVEGEVILAAAARLGATRLIDNLRWTGGEIRIS